MSDLPVTDQPPDSAPVRERSISWPAAIRRGVVLACGQLAAVLLLYALTVQPDLGAAVEGMISSDGILYGRILRDGYDESFNFFPGYPLTARAVSNALGLPTAPALVLTAAVACAGFWAYLWRFFDDLEVPRRRVWAVVVALLVHPGAFYLVCGYSESLFLLAFLGFLYWSNRPGWVAWTLAAAHGFFATFTRLVGLPATAYPLARVGVSRRWSGAVMLTAVASLGAGLVFAYCQWRYGSWKHYMECQSRNWGFTPDYFIGFRLWDPRVYWPEFEDGFLGTNDYSRFGVALTLIGMLALAFGEFKARRDPDWRQQAGLYFVAAVLLYLPLAGTTQFRFQSMLRYLFPVHVILALALLRLAPRLPAAPAWLRDRAELIFIFLCAISAWFEVLFARKFLIGEWVA